jgi:phage N-6-adenine-methyltransferase
MIVTKAIATNKNFTEKDMWETPAHIFDTLNKEFAFNLDPCCTIQSAKCANYYTIDDDGLSKDWSGSTCFVNPPYSRNNIDLWVEKCYLESLKENTIVVALLPVSTSSNWWHKWILNNCQLRYIKQRVRFKGASGTAPFSSVIAVFNKQGASTFNQKML